jgi:N-methylhydantoinase B
MRLDDLVIPNGSLLSAPPPGGAVFLYLEATNAPLGHHAGIRTSARGASDGRPYGRKQHPQRQPAADNGVPWLSSAQVGGEHGPWMAFPGGRGPELDDDAASQRPRLGHQGHRVRRAGRVMRKESVIDTGPRLHRGGACQLRDSSWCPGCVRPGGRSDVPVAGVIRASRPSGNTPRLDEVAYLDSRPSCRMRP